ncbi:zinc ribbon domain-containing protein [Acidilobus sp. 7A]|uniref:RNA-guided endonuclease InsQ/TnpB family protein n=1 Tax=Acidilobus sp. 7A TaxID=1577685 RepID=UPI001B3BCD5F|nr:zinc ribbon domain-containing protein [Acidilobus sp. 7A]
MYRANIARLAVDEGADEEQRGASEVTRTVTVRSEQLPRRTFKVFVELEGMYRNMVEQLVLYAVDNNITKFTRLKAERYREVRSLYPQLPSHYAYTACQDAAERSHSFLKLRRTGRTRKPHPEVRGVSIWLDDHLWRAEGLTSVSLATHRGRVRVSIEINRHILRYVNRGWRLSSEAKVKLDHRERRLIFYLTFRKEVSVYRPKDYITVDVNENAEAVLIDGIVYLFETGLSRVTLGYYYRRKSVQEKYDRVYGPGSRPARRIFRRLGSNEKALKRDIRWKLAALIVREAAKRQAAIVLERLGREPANHMIERIRNPQLRHRIFQAAFKGVQRAIEEKAREYGVPVIYVNPKNTSRKCPIHGAKIVYGKDRHGTCSKGGETWHRDVVACYNLLLRALGGNGGHAPSRVRALTPIDGGPVPLGPTAAHEPTPIARGAWARWKSLGATNKHKQMRTNT